MAANETGATHSTIHPSPDSGISTFLSLALSAPAPHHHDHRHHHHHTVHPITSTFFPCPQKLQPCHHFCQPDPAHHYPQDARSQPPVSPSTTVPHVTPSLIRQSADPSLSPVVSVCRESHTQRPNGLPNYTDESMPSKGQRPADFIK